MRWYLSNDSYPEMRAIESFWERHRTWWKAFGSSLGDPKMWGFLAVAFCLACLGGVLNLMIDVNDLLGSDSPSAGVIANLAGIFLTIGAAVALSLTWGGDIMPAPASRESPLPHGLSGVRARPDEPVAVGAPGHTVPGVRAVVQPPPVRGTLPDRCSTDAFGDRAGAK